MLLWKRVNFMEKKKKVNDMILKWSNENKNFLNIISIPYNSTYIFIDIIKKYLKEDKKILYITEEDPSKVNIILNIKKYTNIKTYTYIKNVENNSCANLNICNFKMAYNLRKNFDLIIYDDISSFSFRNRYEILDILSELANKNSKVIVYSVEEILKNCETILIPIKSNRVPIIEPRTILTRLDINKNIPFVIYDYLKWSIDVGRKVIIFVPDEMKVKAVYIYIKNYCKHFLKDIICFVDNKSDKKLIDKFLNLSNAILITNCLKNLNHDIKNSDIMVYFADHPNFSYKEFVYLCGSVVRGEKDLKGEVIFLANCETEDMEKAKYITRNFNKEAWDMGLLKV